ncbi:MAG: MarR family transcriptional regulator, partial [Candidatus Electryoneaceae bacterium]|nr:MarR family transcriptional regulator [Candidatus Electryoneaceae bacterium]
ATITRALDALESKRYIERHRNNDDRRVQIVSLTDPGRTAYYDMARCGELVNDEAVAELSNEERLQLYGMFKQVLRRMNNLHSKDEGSYAF